MRVVVFLRTGLASVLRGIGNHHIELQSSSCRKCSGPRFDGGSWWGQDIEMTV